MVQPFAASPASDPTSTAHLPVVRGHALPHVQHPNGFLDRLKTGWLFIKGAYLLAWEKKILLAPVLIGGFVSLALFLVLMLLYVALWAMTGDGVGAAEWARQHPILTSFLGLIAVFGLQLVKYFFMGATVSLVDGYLKGLEPNLSTAFLDARKNWRGIGAIAIVATIVELLVSFLRNKRRDSGLIGGVILGSIASMIETAWTVASYLLVPVIMIDDVGLKPAISRARQVHQGNLIQIAVGEVGIRIVHGIVGFIAGLFAVLIVLPLSALGSPGLIIGLLLAALILIPVGVLNSFTRTAYYTCLYLWAVQVERSPAGQPVVVPGPLATALAPA